MAILNDRANSYSDDLWVQRHGGQKAKIRREYEGFFSGTAALMFVGSILVLIIGSFSNMLNLKAKIILVLLAIIGLTGMILYRNYLNKR